ncbi:MAG: hypothetical protein Q8O25_04710 [Sulfurisoma sp.]|nr:hypothetical protein [Sulfurisoma sp.]
MFHMTNSGLPNVWLQSGYRTGEDKFGPYYSIDDLPGLYRAIALSLAHGGGQLSATELRVIRRQLQLTQADLGKRLGRTEQTVLLWERRGIIPADAAQQIKLMVLRHFSPRMTIDDAFRHLEQPKPERIVMARRHDQWECALDCIAPVLRATHISEYLPLSVASSGIPASVKMEGYVMVAGFAMEPQEETQWTIQ